MQKSGVAVDPTNIWDKVDYSVLEETGEGQEKTESSRDEEERKKRRNRRIRIGLDVFGTLAWTYAILKVFFLDIDRLLVERFLPSAEPVVTFRFFVALAVVVVVALASRRYYWALLYVLFFPLIVLLWKIPRAIYKSKSWMVLFGVANVIVGTFGQLRYNLITKSAALFAFLAIVISDGGIPVVVAVVALSALLAMAIFRTVRLSMQPSRFVRTQEKAIKKITEAEPMNTLFQVQDVLKTPQIERFDRQQLTTFTTNLSMTVLAQRSVVFWAHKLDAYRRSSATFLFNAGAYLWLFLQVVVMLTFINMGIHKLDAGAYETVSSSFLQFLSYSLATLYVSETAAIKPITDAALVAKVAGGLIGPTIVATLVLTMILTHRQGTEDAATREAVRGIRRSAQHYERLLKDEYEVSVDEAIERLERLGSGFFLQAIHFLSSQIPDDFDGRYPQK